MNGDATNNSTNQPVTLDNEVTLYNKVTLDAAVFATVAPVATSASTISPDAHFLPSGLKMETGLFSNGDIKNMADKDVIDTTPPHEAPVAYTLDAADQYSGSTDSKSVYSLRNCKFSPYSTNTMETRKTRKIK